MVEGEGGRGGFADCDQGGSVLVDRAVDCRLFDGRLWFSAPSAKNLKVEEDQAAAKMLLCLGDCVSLRSCPFRHDL